MLFPAQEDAMQRITIALDDDPREELDEGIDQRGHQDRTGDIGTPEVTPSMPT